MADNIENQPIDKPNEVVDDSPNANWQEDARLDENGNPKEELAPKGEDAPSDGDEKPEEKPSEDPTEDKDDKEGADKAPTEFDASAASQVESFLTDAGLTPSEVAKTVTENGGKVTPEIMKALVEKHGEGVAGLIKDKLAYLHESSVNVAKARDTAIYSHVEKAFEGITDQSGQESFKELATWARANVPESERNVINKLLAEGGESANLAIDTLVNKFKQSDSFTQPAKLLEAEDVSKEYGGKPLDKAGYDRELRKLLNQGHDYDTSPEIASLNNRRMKSMRRGL